MRMIVALCANWGPATARQLETVLRDKAGKAGTLELGAKGVGLGDVPAVGGKTPRHAADLGGDYRGGGRDRSPVGVDVVGAPAARETGELQRPGKSAQVLFCDPARLTPQGTC